MPRHSRGHRSAQAVGEGSVRPALELENQGVSMARCAGRPGALIRRQGEGPSKRTDLATTWQVWGTVGMGGGLPPEGGLQL